MLQHRVRIDSSCNFSEILKFKLQLLGRFFLFDHDTWSFPKTNQLALLSMQKLGQRTRARRWIMLQHHVRTNSSFNFSNAFQVAHINYMEALGAQTLKCTAEIETRTVVDVMLYNESSLHTRSLILLLHALQRQLVCFVKRPSVMVEQNKTPKSLKLWAH